MNEGLENIIEKETNESKIKQFYDWSSQYINYKLGAIGGSLAGTIVYFMNDEHGVKYGLTAGITQFVYNFLAGGYNSRTCQNIARIIENRRKAIVNSTVFTTVQAFIIGYTVHEIMKTPDLLQSSTWQIIPNAFIFYTIAKVQRNEMENTHSKSSKSLNKLL
ncbi:MAG: hypothetical protein KC589_00955 [Nanoarchaeota archaeon]|nr:hypothetical protein [Nanoarchaeota archaeon]